MNESAITFCLGFVAGFVTCIYIVRRAVQRTLEEAEKKMEGAAR